MAKKITFTATDEQLQQLYDALQGGAPLLMSLQYAGISRAVYFYWVAVASIVEQAKSQEELEQMEECFNSGVSIQQIRDISESATSNKRSAVGTFIEPSAESVLQYQNNRKFRKFADKCYEVISTCDKIRSQVALDHLNSIRESTYHKQMNPSGSMWFLERTMPDFFAKPTDKVVEQSKETGVEPVRIEYVNPDTKDSQERVRDIENDLERQINGAGRA